MKIMSFIRRYAAACAVLAVCMASIAASYLIPADPDSAIFRSGTFGLILLTSCILPLKNALCRTSMRQLLVSLLFGVFFSLALSLGSELLIYDGLLPGTGSLIRRMMVPLMAAPLVGGLCCRLVCLNPIPQKKCAIPAWVFSLIIFLCWLPLLFAYYPGMLNYDFPGQFAQHTSGQYSNLHPLLHSALCNSVIALGEIIHSRTFGLLLMSLLQMVLFSLALGGSCSFAAQHGVKPWVLVFLTALYALHPVFSVMALSMTKDTLFAAAVLTLSLDAFRLIESRGTCTRMQSVRFIICTIGTALLRGNGIFALALMLPVLCIAVRGARRRIALLCTLSAIASCLTLGLLTLALSPASMPSFQLYSLPAQQLVRAYHRGDMTSQEKAELESWYTSAEGLRLHPHLADPAKGYLDRSRIESEGKQLLDLWRSVGQKNTRVYAEAFLMLNVGSWYPDDLSHSTIYPDVSWNDKGYLQTQEYDMSSEGIHTTCFLPAVRNFYERICRRNAHQKYPVISLLFSPALPLWCLLLSCALLVARRRSHLLPSALGAIGLFISYLFGPCTLPRYALPLFCLAPVLLAAAFFSHEEESA